VSAAFRPREDTSVAATLRHSVFRDQFLLEQRGTEAFQYEPTDEHLTSAAVVASSLVHPAHLVTGGLDGSAEALSAIRLTGDGSRERLGVYGQDEWLVVQGRQLILVPGARLDLDTQFGAHASPKLAARWDASERVIARASAGFGYRAPDFRQLLLHFENRGAMYTVNGNPDLDPETSIGGTLSVEVEPAPRLSIAAQGYWNEVDDLIGIDLVEPDMDMDMDEGTAVYQYVNVASARTRGVELQARASLGQRLIASIGYSLADTLDRQAGHELPGRARHRGSFEVRVRPIDRLMVSAHGELVGRRLFFVDTSDDMAEETLAAARYAWIGARAEVEVGKRLSLFVGADNLADSGDSRFLPIAPRSFHAGLRGHYASPEEPTRLAGVGP
jgi:outer membrane receptor for ferrienterochelin and colicins